MKNIQIKVESQSMKTDRLKGMPHAPGLSASDPDSVQVEITNNRRKSVDSPAIVPIKKRRIQIQEASRSPSPPPSLSSCASTPGSVLKGEVVSVDVHSISSLIAVPIPECASPCCPTEGLELHPPVRGDDETKMRDKAEAIMVDKLDTHEHPAEIMNESDDVDNGNPTSEGLLESAYGQSLKDVVIDCIHIRMKVDGDLDLPESGGIDRDDRSNWDLNTNMEAWDALAEKVGHIAQPRNATTISSCLPRINTTGNTQEQSYDMHLGEHLKEVPECGNTGQEHGEQEFEGNKPCVEDNQHFEAGALEKLEMLNPCGEKQDLCEGKNMEGEVVEKPNPDVEENQDTLEETLEKPELVDQVVDDPETVEHHTRNVEMEDDMEGLEKGKLFFENVEPRYIEKEDTSSSLEHLDSEWNGTERADLCESGRPFYDADSPVNQDNLQRSSMAVCTRDDTPSKPKFVKQARTSNDDAEVFNYEPEFEEHVDYGDSDCRDPDDLGVDVDEKNSMQVESAWKEEEYDMQSPKVIAYYDDNLNMDEIVKSDLSNAKPHSPGPSPERHMPAGRSRATGWDQLPEGFDSAEEALRAAKDGAAWRGRVWNTSAGRGPSHAARRFGHAISMHNSMRDGPSCARGDDFFEDRHGDDHSYDRDRYRNGRRVDDSYSVRGRETPRRPGSFGRGRGGGWMDSQPGHMNQWGPGRARPGFNGPSMTGAAATRGDNGGFVRALDGTMSKHGMGPGRGVRSTITGGRGGRAGQIRGPPVDIDSEVHYPLRKSSGTDRTGGLGNGFETRYAGNMHDRGRRRVIDRRGGGMDSRSLSPRRQHPLDHRSMVSQVSSGMRFDSRVERSGTPPFSRSGGLSEYKGTRNHHSPPSSRWSSDKRESDSYQDRDFKRPLSRSRVPAQRTSPHAVHGSSLNDERGHQVLGGNRHSPLKNSLTSVQLQESEDDTLESRLCKRPEDDDARRAGFIAKDDGDYRRMSPSRENDREERGSFYRKERDKYDEQRRDFYHYPSRDNRFLGGHKYLNTRTDDDAAPRRRRPL
ncbi:hypothetical protein KP509_37G032800 [Ceratopteris richardii]|nr:hypothetical protein KP509_37G032800 [Ceratopteris richardii]KAH7279715.1 hypothetical protein KP509_37G032800 [Ceratopteris richardii]KAH7279716.1 hypothetical protein KP509_37G032800 [Ceratopteris richardii]KAH7279717.1 hypothetical protein KP509_37G032800 [Ceratopteris richardii]